MLSALVDDADGLLSAAGGRRTLLGLAGPPAAGKSTLARRLVRDVERRRGPGTAAYLPMDGFLLAGVQLDRLALRDRAGAPETYDVDGFVHLLGRLRAGGGRAVYLPDFDRRLGEPVAAGLVVPPSARLVVAEGSYLADDGPGWREVRGLLDALWYVEVPARIREARLLRRRLRGGATRREARAAVETTDRPNAARAATGRGNCARVIQR